MTYFNSQPGSSAIRVRAGQGADPFGRQPYGRKGLRPVPLPESTHPYIRAKAGSLVADLDLGPGLTRSDRGRSFW